METIQVSIRIRPFLSYEDETNTTIQTFEDDNRKIILAKNNKKFVSHFDRIFPQNSKQEDVYNFINPIISLTLKGINSTILAYGQTGSGKTYTMFGEDFTMNDNYNGKLFSKRIKKDKYNFLVDQEFVIDPFSNTNGIIPRVILDLFKYKNKSKTVITCSYIQVYNERIYDLLTDNTFKKPEKNLNFETAINNNRSEKVIDQENLKIRDDKKLGPVVDGALELEANNFYDVFQMLRTGELNRKKRQTNKNEMSSRSHSIFMIYYNNKEEKKKAKISLCDLAGSEKYESSEHYKQVHFNELKSINKSLSILGNVIHALAKKKKVHIPYKDSTLTHLLSKNLEQKTYLIATISPSDNNFEDSLNTLNFADRSHIVSTKVTPNNFEDNLLDSGLDKITIKKLSQELKELRQLLKIRSKRGTLEPIQQELIKLKEENSELKRLLNNPNVQKLIQENEYLRKELQKYSVSQTPYDLTEKTESNQFSTFTYDNYNYYKYDLSPKNKYKSNKNLYDNLNNNDILTNAGKNIISSHDFSNKKLGKNKNNYISYINNGRGKSSKVSIHNNIIDNTNKKLKMYDDLQMKSKLRTEELVDLISNKDSKNKRNKGKKIGSYDFLNNDIVDDINNFDIGNDEDFDV
jgi:hypothetical protein